MILSQETDINGLEEEMLAWSRRLKSDQGSLNQIDLCSFAPKLKDRE